jgi:aldose 1-epimerase
MSLFGTRVLFRAGASLAAILAVSCPLSSPSLPAPFVALDLRAETRQSGSVAGSSASTDLQIGGQRVITLKRNRAANAATPEFLSATVLPGRGMNLFQVTAYLPGKGEIPVLASPPLAEAAAVLNGDSADVHGVKSFTFGGAFLVPYANRIRGKLSPDGKTITTEWNGKTLTLPAVWKGKKNPDAELHAIHGLILDAKTDELSIRDTPDGQIVTGVMHAGNFGGYWPSQSDVSIQVALTGQAVEATITVKNVGKEAEPIGIGWHPYFAIPSGNRSQARLHIPASQLAEVNNYDDVFPTGKFIPVAGTKYDFTAPRGRPLNDIFLDDNFSTLHRTNGKVVVNLIDPAADYGIHIEGLSDKIRTIQVYAPPDQAFAAIEEQFNFADPFSSLWNRMDTGMATLQPNHSVTWKVRLVLFTPSE